MADFKLNNISKNLSFSECKKEIAKFGILTFLAEFKEDKFKKDLFFSFGKFKELKNKNGFIEYCQSKNITPTVDGEKFTKSQSEKNRTSSTIQIHEKRNNQPEKQPQTAYQNSQKRILTISNPSFHYYKEICKDLKDLNCYGRNIESFKFEDGFSNLYDFNLPEYQTFELTTTYPGLLVGSGYNHPKLKDKNNNEDFQLGFFFDHTTGLPIISGSSIKGLLRSVFEKTDFVKDIYPTYYKDYMNIDVFEKGQIIFYDAFIVSTQNKNNKIFGSDYITPHKNSDANSKIPDEFCEPIPIKFLKILPKVRFKFQFQSAFEVLDEKRFRTIQDTKLVEYLNLFKQIILDFGLGAKTNVGYGKFSE